MSAEPDDSAAVVAAFSASLKFVIRADTAFAFLLSDYIKHTKDSKAKNPVSKKSLEASLDAIVKLLLPSSKALKEDLQYFDDLYLTSGKNFKEVRFANKSKMKRYFTEDLHKILTGKPFGFDAAALKD